ncbi:MAG: T9SS type A sorting domain-containing protein, partial [Candidatus Cloacimonadaceae bacterium]|nr:T9SS type A sorting domain-containing protein [Candidatus Cloacimonadaceae bacterium]
LRLDSNAKSEVNFRIFNLRGQLVGEINAAPNSTVNWKADKKLASGIYFVKATQNSISQSTKVLKIK